MIKYCSAIKRKTKQNKKKTKAESQKYLPNAMAFWFLNFIYGKPNKI